MVTISFRTAEFLMVMIGQVDSRRWPCNQARRGEAAAELSEAMRGRQMENSLSCFEGYEHTDKEKEDG